MTQTPDGTQVNATGTLSYDFTPNSEQEHMGSFVGIELTPEGAAAEGKRRGVYVGDGLTLSR